MYVVQRHRRPGFAPLTPPFGVYGQVLGGANEKRLPVLDDRGPPEGLHPDKGFLGKILRLLRRAATTAQDHPKARGNGLEPLAPARFEFPRSGARTGAGVIGAAWSPARRRRHG